MRLISCYIAGFGRIADYSYEFTKGLNTIYQENGWGKTTFSVFIKSMFFGMEYSRKKELSEREHYLPWDTNQYGGNLVFETEDKTYRIERSFGKTNKNDEFRLIDIATGKESTDYSENIGEELFEVDRESFEKSIFIPQDALVTTMTDSLNAKMGDLSAAKDDVNNFDLAMNRVEESRRSYTRNSKINPGKLVRLKQEIRNTNELLEQLPALNDGYEKKVKLIEEKKDELKALEEQKMLVAEKIRHQSKNEQQLGAYREKKELLDKEKERLVTLDDFFSNGIPEMDEQTAIEEEERQLAIVVEKTGSFERKLPDSGQITLWNELFVRKKTIRDDENNPVTTAEDDIPTDEELEHWQSQATRLHELRIQGKHSQMSEENKAQLNELKQYFAKKHPKSDEMEFENRQINELNRLDGKISEVEDRYRTLQIEMAQENKNIQAAKNPAAMLVVIVLAIVLCVGGVAFQLVSHLTTLAPLAMISFVVAAFIVVIYGMRSHKDSQLRNKKSQANEEHLQVNEQQLKEYREQREELAKSCKAFLSDFLVTPTESMQQMIQEIQRKLDLYERLLEEEAKTMESTTGTLDELSDLQLQLYTALDSFAKAYHMDLYYDTQEMQLLTQLKEDASLYQNYVGLCKQILESKQEAEELRNHIRKYILRFPVTEADSVQEQLQEIRQNMARITTSTENVTRLEEEMKAFEQQHQVDENIESVEFLQDKQKELDELISELNQVITVDRDSLSVLAEKLETCEDAETNLEHLENTLQEYEARVKVLEQTGEYLLMAKEQFLSKYMGPLQNSLRKYLKLLSETAGDIDVNDFGLDMDLSIHYMHHGMSKEGEYLSAGYQDLLALCSRFALLDVLYEKEQPVIVLDDPFTNFDEEKVQRGLKLLSEIAEDRQVIYYTCHKSRI